MARSLVRLSGRRRVASALGVGLLVGSLALVGCSSSSLECVVFLGLGEFFFP